MSLQDGGADRLHNPELGSSPDPMLRPAHPGRVKKQVNVGKPGCLTIPHPNWEAANNTRDSGSAVDEQDLAEKPDVVICGVRGALDQECQRRFWLAAIPEGFLAEEAFDLSPW